MNFLKKMMGYPTNDLKSQIQNTNIDGTFYKVIKDTRNIIIPNAKISFENDGTDYFIKFKAKITEEQKQFAFPIYVDMDLVRFIMNKQGKTNSCFEWKLDQGDHVGCYMNPNDQQKFQDIVCKVLKVLYDDQNIKDHMKLCKPLSGVPVYKEKQEVGSEKSNINSSTISKAKLADINDILIRQASKKQNKMVHTGIQFEIIDKQRNLKNQPIIFVLKNVGQFAFQFQLINATGFTYLRKQFTSSLIYQINTDLSYIRWLHDKQDFKIVQVNFQGKKDVSLTLKYALVQCQYQQNTKRRLQDAIAQDQITYLQRISDKAQTSNKIVKTYEDVQEQIQIKDQKFVYGNKQAQKSLQKYKNLCQGKVNNFDIASLGSMLQVLRISDDNDVQRVQLKKIQPKSKQNINLQSIHLHDKDSKAVLNGQDGKLYYYDLEKGNIVQQYNISTKGIQDICPQFKLAETDDFKTFKAVSPNSIFEVDPRIKQSIVNSKSYQTNPEFNHICVNEKGNFAVSSQNGQIRLYDKIGRNANCKYPAFGDPVLHLDSTKDGKWLLATFKNYLLLIPTQTQDDISLYENKIKIDERPRPVKLKIKLEHLQFCKVKQIEMIPAKFEQRKNGKERFIVSGFGQNVVIWNLARVIRGDTESYRFTNIGGDLVQTDFKFNNAKKLLMTTNNGIVIKENKVQ